MINSLLNSAQSIEWIEALVDVALKSALILMVAGAVSMFGRRASASTRHLVWTLALGGLLLLPVLSFVLPDWRISILPSLVSAPAAVSAPRIESEMEESWVVSDRSAVDVEVPALTAQVKVEEPVTPPAPIQKASASTSRWLEWVKWEKLHWTQIVFLIWLLGALAVLARLALATIRVRAFARECDFVIDYKWTATAKRLERQLQLPGHVSLRRSSYITTPMTCGILSP